MSLSSKQAVSKVEKLRMQLKKSERRRLNYLKLKRECYENCERAKINNDIFLVEKDIIIKNEAIENFLMAKEIDNDLCTNCGGKVSPRRLEFLKEGNEPITCISCAAIAQGSFQIKTAIFAERYPLAMGTN